MEVAIFLMICQVECVFRIKPKNVNSNVFNIITRTNGLKTLAKHISYFI